MLTPHMYHRVRGRESGADYYCNGKRNGGGMGTEWDAMCGKHV